MSNLITVYYPILLNSNSVHECTLSTYCTLEKLTKQKRKDFFNVKKCVFDFDVCSIKEIQYYKNNQNQPRFSPGTGFAALGFLDILASNYVLKIVAEDPQDLLLEKVNTAFRLFHPTSTGGYVGFREGEGYRGQFSLHWRKTFGGIFPYLKINNKKTVHIQKILSKLDDKHEPKIDTAIDLYSKAVSSEKMSIEDRFLSLMTSLEVIYFPDGQNDEITIKLALRAASNLGTKVSKSLRAKIFQDIRDLYKIRSKIIHSGTSGDITSNDVSLLIEYTKASILSFLEEPEKFSRKAFDNFNPFLSN